MEEPKRGIVTDPFWYDQIDILYNTERLSEFFPSSNQTLAEKFNSLMRLSFYIAVLLAYHHKNYNSFVLVVGVALFTIYLYSRRESKETKQSIENFDAEGCTKPTIDNPFMNATMKDYLNIRDSKIVDRPAACDTSTVNVKEEIDKNFNNNLYRDVNDVFGKMNSQRQFYTMPWTTIPNDRETFQNWLYKSPSTCKENQNFCLRAEDVRSKSSQGLLLNPNENPFKSKQGV